MPPVPPTSERQAQGKFHCPACGGETTWDPSTKTLVCAYCATPASEHPEALVQKETIREHDLAEALEQLPDSARGWNPKASSVRCQSCNAISVFEAEQAGKRCDFCGSSALVPYQELQQSIRPESLLPLRIAESQIRDADFGAEVETIARRLASASPHALRTMKRNFVDAETMDLETYLQVESERHLQVMAHSDAKEAFRAFVEKRPPRFGG